MGISYIPPFNGNSGQNAKIETEKGLFKATQGQTTFNLTMDYASTDLLFVHHNNLYMEETINYTVQGKIVTITAMNANDIVSWTLIKCGTIEKKKAILGQFKLGELKLGEGLF